MKNIGKNYALNIIYNVIAIALPFFLTPYLTRTLGSDGIGEYSYYFSYASYFALFSVMGIPNYGNRTIAKAGENIKDRSQAFLEIYIVQMAASILVTVAYGLFVHFFCHDNMTAWIFSIYVLAFCFDVSWLFLGMEQFKITITRNFIIKVITVIFVFVFVKNKEHVWLYAFIYSGGTILANGMMLSMVGKAVRLGECADLKPKKHIKSILILFIPYLAVSVYKIMDKVMLGLMTQTSEVGYYESSERVINLPMVFVTSLGTVMMPRISNMVGKGDKEEESRYMHKSIVFIMFLSSAMCLGVAAVADVFVPIFYGDGFEKCVDLLTILMPSCLFLAFANVIRTQYLLPHEMDKPFVISLVVGAVINFTLNSILIPVYASVGAAIGTLITEIAVCVGQCLGVKNKLPILKYVCSSFPFIIAGSIMYIVVRTISFQLENEYLCLLVKTMIGVVIYLLLIGIILLAYDKIKHK